jgi:hypothetical protein
MISVFTEITDDMSRLAYRPCRAPASREPRDGHERRPLDYARLLGDAWNRLPADVRERFSAHDALWTGAMTLEATRRGRWITRLLRLVGAPLPPTSAEPVPTTVRVEADPETGGSRWTRRYELAKRTIEARSVKCVDAAGGLVERLGMGLRMELTLRADRDALHFVSTGYYLELPLAWPRSAGGALRLHLPSWWLPGQTHVVHRDLGRGRFRFTMTIRHKLLGEILHHDGIFRRKEVDHVCDAAAARHSNHARGVRQPLAP